MISDNALTYEAAAEELKNSSIQKKYLPPLSVKLTYGTTGS